MIEHIDLFPSKIFLSNMESERLHSYNYIQKLQAFKQEGLLQDVQNCGSLLSEPNLQEVPVFRELVLNLNNIGNDIARTMGYEFQVELAKMWGSYSGPGAFSWKKSYGGVFNGILYLQANESSGDLVLTNPVSMEHIHISREEDKKITPRPMLLCVTPAWMETYEEPNRSEEDKIAIRFNFGVR
jgi:hypothetical protein